MADEPTLRWGDREADGWVKYLQQLLTVRTQIDLDPDGVFGNQTINAVYHFQAAHGLMQDGVVGNQTWAALRGEEPEAPGTDGLAAHTHLEGEQRAEWATDHNEIQYDHDDSMYMQAVNVGSAAIENETSVYVVFTKPSGEQVVRDDGFLVPHTGEFPVEPGAVLHCLLRELRAQLGEGTHQVEATLAGELGGDVKQGELTIPPT
jgi:lysozyme family protein